jgi:predicted transglutaminase-like cysteine proteinase
MARIYSTTGKTFVTFVVSMLLSGAPAAAHDDIADAFVKPAENVVQMATLFAPKALPARPRPIKPAKVTYVKQGMPVLAPFGHIRFCVQNPDECEASTHVSSTQAAATTDAVEQARQINELVNNAIEPQSDDAKATGDVWTLAPSAGDCDDYAVTKRSFLIKAGWSAANVLLAHVVTRQGIDHLVTIIRTDDGDFVLDNLDRTVRAVHEVRYRWVSVQSAENPRFWHRADLAVRQLLLARL